MEQQKVLKQIEDNYNMGFITYREYCCQRTHARGQMKKWHILCLIPAWIFNLIDRTVITFKLQ